MSRQRPGDDGLQFAAAENLLVAYFAREARTKENFYFLSFIFLFLEGAMIFLLRERNKHRKMQLQQQSLFKCFWAFDTSPALYFVTDECRQQDFSRIIQIFHGVINSSDAYKIAFGFTFDYTLESLIKMNNVFSRNRDWHKITRLYDGNKECDNTNRNDFECSTQKTINQIEVSLSSKALRSLQSQIMFTNDRSGR